MSQIFHGSMAQPDNVTTLIEPDTPQSKPILANYLYSSVRAIGAACEPTLVDSFPTNEVNSLSLWVPMEASPQKLRYRDWYAEDGADDFSSSTAILLSVYGVAPVSISRIDDESTLMDVDISDSDPIRFKKRLVSSHHVRVDVSKLKKVPMKFQIEFEADNYDLER